MDYNTSRENLKLSEYGRNIQNMIQYLMTIEDREQRTEEAQVVYNVMHSMHDNPKNTQEFKDKIWEQIAFISDYQLDIDYPCDIIKITEAGSPNKPEYSSNYIKYRHFGKNIERMLLNISEIENEELKEKLLGQTANHMKKLYVLWHNKGVEDEVIRESIIKLSQEGCALSDDFSFINTKEIMTNAAGPNPNKKKILKAESAAPANQPKKKKRQRIKRQVR